MARGDDERVVEAGTGGALGGAAAGYLGGGPLNLADFSSKALLAAGIGAAAGLLVLLASVAWSPGRRREVVRESWWLPVAGAAALTLIACFKDMLDWAFGQALAGWAVGWRAAALGAVIGAILFGGIKYLTLRRRRG